MVHGASVRSPRSSQRTIRFLAFDEERNRSLERELTLLGHAVLHVTSIEETIFEEDVSRDEDALYIVIAQTRRKERLLTELNILAKTVEQPIVLVTGALPESHRLQILRMGATAILENTLSTRELALRISGIITALGGTDSSYPATGVFRLREDELEINEATHKVYLNGEFLRLTETEWRILHYLAARSQAIVARHVLVDDCMGYQDGVAYLRSLDAHIKNLRRKLGQSDWIETVRGYGYQFVGRIVQPLQ